MALLRHESKRIDVEKQIEQQREQEEASFLFFCFVL